MNVFDFAVLAQFLTNPSVRARDISFGDLAIEQRLVFGLILGPNVQAGFILAGRLQAGSLAGALGVHAAADPPEV